MPDVAPVPAGAHTVNPYLLLKDVRALIDFCVAAFDATVGHRSLDGDRISHVQFAIGDSIVMAGEAPTDEWLAPANLYVYVPDCDAVFARAVAAGATSIMEPATMFYGDRHGGVRDANGNVWWIATHVEDVPDDELDRRHAVEMRRRREGASG
jgi:PhnB protein